MMLTIEVFQLSPNYAVLIVLHQMNAIMQNMGDL